MHTRTMTRMLSSAVLRSAFTITSRIDIRTVLIGYGSYLIPTLSIRTYSVLNPFTISQFRSRNDSQFARSKAHFQARCEPHGQVQTSICVLSLSGGFHPQRLRSRTYRCNCKVLHNRRDPSHDDAGAVLGSRSPTILLWASGNVHRFVPM
jgi:hypothetical protein